MSAAQAQLAVVSEHTATTVSNPTRRVVDEMVSLMGDIHDAKEEILARGVPFHTVNVMVELSARGKLDEQAKMRETALQTSADAHGAAAITSEMLDKQVATLVALEKDLGHVRKLGKSQGLDMTSVNYLTMIIRQNPGDGGEKVINTFLAYALACDIPLHRVNELAEQASAGPKSVLPEIEREDAVDTAVAAKKQLIADVIIGCFMAFFALVLLT